MGWTTVGVRKEVKEMLDDFIQRNNLKCANDAIVFMLKEWDKNAISKPCSCDDIHKLKSELSQLKDKYYNLLNSINILHRQLDYHLKMHDRKRLKEERFNAKRNK